MSAIDLRNLGKRYPGGGGVGPITLTLEPGERFVLLGPSGSGKSTLLRLIAGLETASTGEVWLHGERVDRWPPHQRGVGLLAQPPALYPQMTVRENLSAGRGTEPARVARATAILRLERLLDRLPHQLSGGERQRVALGKLLARPTRIWLLDEPFVALDAVFRDEFRHDLHLLLAEAQATMILVTHDPIDAWALGRRIGVLSSGSLTQVGTPDQLATEPGHQYVAACLGRVTLLSGQAIGSAGGGDPSGEVFVPEGGSPPLMIPAPWGAVIRQQATPNLTLGIRPEDVVAVTSATPAPPGIRFANWPVVSAEPVGSGWLLTVARERSRLRVSWVTGSPPPVGAPADWLLPADRCLWFDGSGQRITLH